jgi:hypothetical protein
MRGLFQPPLEELLRQPKAIDDLANDGSASRYQADKYPVTALTPPDDLFNFFFDKLRGELLHHESTF